MFGGGDCTAIISLVARENDQLWRNKHRGLHQQEGSGQAEEIRAGESSSYFFVVLCPIQEVFFSHSYRDFASVSCK